MTMYHPATADVRTSELLAFSRARDALSGLVLRFDRWLAARHTRRVLERQDRAVLADIGVQHCDMDPRTGELNRYCQVIRPRR